MKKFIFTLIVAGSLFICGRLNAAPIYAEAPIKSVGTPATIAVSSTTLTKVPTSQTSGRMGVYINNPSTSSVVGFMGDCTSTSLASTIRPIQIGLQTATIASSILYYLPLMEEVCLWLISLNTAASTSNIHIQEVSK